MNCDCQHASECEFAQVRETGGRLFDLCRGVNCSPGQSARYRRSWGDPQPDVARPGRADRPPRCLAGRELKAIAAKWGFTPSGGCGCEDHAATMDRNGCDWCEEHVETIVGWLRAAYARDPVKALGVPLPFSPFVARRVVRLAIRRARKILVQKE